MTINFVKWDGKNIQEVTDMLGDVLENDAPIIDLGWEEYIRIVKNEGLTIKTRRGWEDVSIGDKIIREGNIVFIMRID